MPESDVLETDEPSSSAPLERGRRSAPRRSGFACAASRTIPSGPRRTAPRPRVPRSAQGAVTSSAKSLERRRDRCKRREELRVAVSLDDLRRARRWLEPERFTREPLDLGWRRRIRSDRARKLADPHPLERSRESVSIAVELERPAGELEPERRRLGVHSVGAADRQRVLELEARARDNRGERFVERPEEQLTGIAHGERERRVEHVRGGEAVVDPSSFRSDLLRKRVDECGDVVIRRPLELGDAFDGRDVRTLAPDRLHCARRYGAELAPRIERCELHQEPTLELRLLRPDARHFRSGVARDHCDDSRGPAHGLAGALSARCVHHSCAFSR